MPGISTQNLDEAGQRKGIVSCETADGFMAEVKTHILPTIAIYDLSFAAKLNQEH